MRVHVSASRALKLFTGLEKRIVAAVMVAEALTVADAQAEAIRSSSGTLTTKTLRRMRHPYARRDPQTPLDPGTINAQSGRFRRAWRTRRPVKSGKRITTWLRNSDPKARFMRGTELMVERPVLLRVVRAIRPMRRYRLRRALWGAVISGA